VPRGKLPPEFLVDRCLGKSVAEAIRELGHIVHTLESVYGAAAALTVDDEDWLGRAGQRGWIVLTKDKKIRHNRFELAMIHRARAKVFCLTSGNLTGSEQVNRFVQNLNRIIARSARRGPMVFAVLEKSLERIERR